MDMLQLGTEEECDTVIAIPCTQLGPSPVSQTQPYNIILYILCQLFSLQIRNVCTVSQSEMGHLQFC